MYCFEVDFNRGANNLFTIVHTEEDNFDFMRRGGLPKEGDTVFVMCLEYSTHVARNGGDQHLDVGVGFVTKVKRVWQNERTVPDDYIIDFERPE